MSNADILAVSGYWSNAVHLYDLASGSPLGALPAPGAQTAVVSPDGTWLVCAELDNALLTFDPESFTQDPTPLLGAEAGFDGPTSATWGPDGNLYVASFNDDRVVRLDPDGHYVDDFVPAGSGGLDGPDIGTRFGPDGNLYVPGWYSGAVHVYDRATGAWLEDVLTPEDRLGSGRGLTFDPTGGLYATGQEGDVVLYRSPEGVVTRLVETTSPAGLTWHEGRLLVANDRADSVRAFDPVSGEALGTVVNDEALEGATAVSVLTR